MPNHYTNISGMKRCFIILNALSSPRLHSNWKPGRGELVRSLMKRNWSSTSGRSSQTPSQVYSARVQNKEIEEDAHQLEVIKAFDKLHKELTNYRPAPKSSSTSFFGGLFGGSSTANANVKMPKGLYIHGAVGGGKTLCMDLFHDVAPVQRKLRVHFHSFMSDVHARIHRVKQETVHNFSHGTKPRVYDPIPPVAEGIAEETWLLCFDEFQVSRFRIYYLTFNNLYNFGIVKTC